VAGDDWITLTHDPGIFAQLITNLVTNSIKHAYAEGESGQLHKHLAKINYIIIAVGFQNSFHIFDQR